MIHDLLGLFPLFKNDWKEGDGGSGDGGGVYVCVCGGGGGGEGSLPRPFILQKCA